MPSLSIITTNLNKTIKRCRWCSPPFLKYKPLSMYLHCFSLQGCFVLKAFYGENYVLVLAYNAFPWCSILDTIMVEDTRWLSYKAMKRTTAFYKDQSIQGWSSLERFVGQLFGQNIMPYASQKGVVFVPILFRISDLQFFCMYEKYCLYSYWFYH